MPKRLTPELRRALRMALVDVAPDTATIRRIVGEAGVPSGDIVFDGGASNVWSSVIEQAENHARVPALVSIARRDFPDENELKALETKVTAFFGVVAAASPPTSEDAPPHRDEPHARRLQELCDALRECVHSYDDLVMMADRELNLRLEEEDGRRYLDGAIVDLVAWAERTERVGDLEIGALNRFPAAPMLHAYGQKHRVIDRRPRLGTPEDDGEDFLLSELRSFPRLQRLFLMDSRGAIAFVVALFLGALTLILARLADADCMQFTVTGMQGARRVGEIHVPFGYRAELNHGVFYFVIVPAFVFVSLRYLDRAKATLRQMVKAGQLFTLTVRGARSSRPLERIADVNRAVSRVVGFIAAMAACVMVVGEASTFRARMFGWVQAWNVQNFRAVRVSALWDGGKMPASSLVCESGRRVVAECVAVVTDVRGGNDHRTAIFWAFLVVAMAHQIAFISYAWLLIARLIVLYVTLYDGLRRRARDDGLASLVAWVVGAARRLYGGVARLLSRAEAGADARESQADQLRVELDFEDPERRFGLRAFDAFYDLTLVLALMGGIGITFQRVSNIPKGVNFANSGNFALLGQAGLLLLVTFVIFMVILIPATLLLRFADEQKDRRREVLLALRSFARQERADAEVRSYDEKLALLDAQDPWPRRDRWFVKLLGVVLVFTFVLPIALTVFPRAAQWATPLTGGVCGMRIPPPDLDALRGPR